MHNAFSRLGARLRRTPRKKRQDSKDTRIQISAPGPVHDGTAGQGEATNLRAPVTAQQQHDVEGARSFRVAPERPVRPPPPPPTPAQSQQQTERITEMPPTKPSPPPASAQPQQETERAPEMPLRMRPPLLFTPRAQHQTLSAPGWSGGLQAPYASQQQREIVRETADATRVDPGRDAPAVIVSTNSPVDAMRAAATGQPKGARIPGKWILCPTCGGSGLVPHITEAGVPVDEPDDDEPDDDEPKSNFRTGAPTENRSQPAGEHMLSRPGDLIVSPSWGPAQSSTDYRISDDGYIREVKSHSYDESDYPDITQREILAEGGQGVVYVAHLQKSRKLVAIKKVSRDKTKPAREPIEWRVLTAIPRRHPNIIERIRLFFQESNRPDERSDLPWHIVSEYCEGGDMYTFKTHWIRELEQPIPHAFQLHFLSSMAKALAFIHRGLYSPTNTNYLEGPVDRRVHPPLAQSPLIHRDIKPENIFLRTAGHRKYDMPDIVLADFGLAVPERNAATIVGTDGYYAPEALDFLNYKNRSQLTEAEFGVYLRGHEMRHGPVLTAASDIYALGVCVYQLMYAPRDFLFLETLDPPAILRLNSPSPSLQWDVKDFLGYRPSSRINTDHLFELGIKWEWELAKLHSSGELKPQDWWFPKQKVLGQGAEAGKAKHGHAQQSIVRPPQGPIVRHYNRPPDGLARPLPLRAGYQAQSPPQDIQAPGLRHDVSPATPMSPREFGRRHAQEENFHDRRMKDLEAWEAQEQRSKPGSLSFEREELTRRLQELEKVAAQQSPRQEGHSGHGAPQEHHQAGQLQVLHRHAEHRKHLAGLPITPGHPAQAHSPGRPENLHPRAHSREWQPLPPKDKRKSAESLARSPNVRTEHPGKIETLIRSPAAPRMAFVRPVMRPPQQQQQGYLPNPEELSHAARTSNISTLTRHRRTGDSPPAFSPPSNQALQQQQQGYLPNPEELSHAARASDISTRTRHRRSGDSPPAFSPPSNPVLQQRPAYQPYVPEQQYQSPAYPGYVSGQEHIHPALRTHNPAQQPYQYLTYRSIGLQPPPESSRVEQAELHQAGPRQAAPPRAAPPQAPVTGEVGQTPAQAQGIQPAQFPLGHLGWGQAIRRPQPRHKPQGQPSQPPK